MNITLLEYKQKLERKKGEKERIEKDISLLIMRKREENRKVMDIEEAQRIIQEVAQKTQSQLEYHISNLGSLALSSVFSDPYELVLRFIQKRGKTEADVLFKRNGIERNPNISSGFGAINVAAFALRAAIWKLKKTRNTLILDEPFRDVKGGDLPEKAANLAKMISEKLKLQIIMVSHVDELIEVADKIFRVKKRNKISKVEEI